MKISIITAVYNRANTIGGALDSVSQQTYANVEHLIIDGKSSDGTIDQVLLRQHAGMRIISEPDQGIYDALNKGMRLATGEIIGLVHSDDVLAHDEVLAQVARAFEDPQVDAVYGDLDYVAGDDATRIVRRWRSGHFERGKLRRGWMPPHPALFIHRRLFDRHGGYDVRYQIAADYDAMLRWLGQDEIRAVYVPDIFVKMRVGGESNRSIERILRKSREDLDIIRRNGVGGLGTLAFKNLSKLQQFLVR